MHSHQLILIFCILISSPYLGSAWKSRPVQYGEQAAVELGGNPKIVFLAGPHNAAFTSVKIFLSKFSGPFRIGHQRTKSMNYWRWGGGENIEKLVTNPDSAESVLSELKNANKLEANGMVLASPMFDQVGPYATYDALKSMKKVTDYFHVSPSDVTVILHYRAPRVEQFISMWKHTTPEGMSFTDWMCDAYPDEKEKALKLDQLGARMNPLNAAVEFLKAGYDVKLVDLGGLTPDQHILHVVGCEILQGYCINGRIYKHEDNVPQHNVGEKKFDELTKKGDYDNAEKLFQLRDCAYQKALEGYEGNGKFEFLHKNATVWSTCEAANEENYIRLAHEPEIMYSALLSQLDCGDKKVSESGMSMEQALSTKTYHGKRYNADSSSGSFSFPMLLVVIMFGYQAYSLNLKRPLRNRSTKNSVVVDEDAEMVEFIENGSKGI